MAVLNPNVHHVAIDGALFQDEVEERQVMSVPSIYLNGEPFDQGRMSLEQILAKVDTGAARREAAKLNEKDAFDVLGVGGGPAGAAAARRPPMPRARASAPALPPSASAARCSTPWPSRTSSPCPTPKAPSWPRRWKSTSRSMRSTS